MLASMGCGPSSSFLSLPQSVYVDGSWIWTYLPLPPCTLLTQFVARQPKFVLMAQNTRNNALAPHVTLRDGWWADFGTDEWSRTCTPLSILDSHLHERFYHQCFEVSQRHIVSHNPKLAAGPHLISVQDGETESDFVFVLVRRREGIDRVYLPSKRHLRKQLVTLMPQLADANLINVPSTTPLCLSLLQVCVF